MVFDSGARQLFSWEEVIDEKPLTASSQTLLPHALAKFVAQSDTSCMIALRHGKVAGIVTRQDLLSAIAHKANWARLRLTKVMTHPVITVAKSELSLVAASLLQQFKQHQISHLPVVDDDNTLIGIISYRHLLVIFREQKAEISIKRQHQHAQLFAEITLKIRQSLQLKEILQTTAEEVQNFGYAFYFKYVTPEDLDLLLKINKAGFDFYEDIAIEKRKDYVAKGMKHAYEGRYHLGKDVSASRESCVW